MQCNNLKQILRLKYILNNVSLEITYMLKYEMLFFKVKKFETLLPV